MVLGQPDIDTRRRIDTAMRVLPAGWIQRVERAREDIAWTLQTLSANALELSALWIGQGFSEKLLVDVSSNSFSERLPMEAVEFEAHQQECHERVKSALWTHWLPKSAEIFRLIPPVCINGDAEAYYRSIATLQGNQLRSLVQDSLDAYVQFFEAHAGDDLIAYRFPVMFR
jgi:dynein heavy chain, axonemal